MPNPKPQNDIAQAEYVTVMSGGQLFGLPISRVDGVFVPSRITPVPLAPDEIAGITNLRGRIVTAIDLGRRIGGNGGSRRAPMAVAVECDGEAYGLLIDSVGEVLKLGADSAEPLPVNLDGGLKRVASGVHRIDGGLLVILDVDRILDFKTVGLAA